MTTGTRLLRAGTRASRLARWQTARVAALLRDRTGVATDDVVVSTEGDRVLDRPLPEIGGKGVFTEALEDALRDGAIDYAVHSLKDLPVDPVPGITIGAVLLRADPRDVLIARGAVTLATLPRGARVGTSSTRREAQLRAARPDLAVLPLRGNVDTRVARAIAGDYDAIVIAAAGVERLGLAASISEALAFDVMLPAPGQGALVVECRAGDAATLEILSTIDDALVRATTGAERAFLAGLGGGCAAPIAALAETTPGGLRLRGLVATRDGRQVIRVDGTARVDQREALGARLAREALDRGAGAILA
ncbi:MAG TPA: hydroxymethylbilane synthase [Gemmatimonadales bacterium]